MRVNIPFVGPSYQARSTYASAERSINCYTEANASERAPVVLYGTPGLRLVATLPTLGCRGAITVGNFAWCIYGNNVYRVSTDNSFVACGALGTSAGIVGIASNGTEILIVDGLNGYIVDIVTNTTSAISDAEFPNGVTHADYLDGSFVVNGNDSQQFFYSALLNGGSWDGLDFASAEGSPDTAVGLIVDHRELWLFGSNSVEIWSSTEDPDLPFQRSGNAFIEHGCVSSRTIKKLDNTIFWLGGDDRGFGVVWRANGYTPQRVSNHAIEAAIAEYAVISDATAITYNQEGTAFYVLNFPSADKTWVYNVSRDEWDERAYRNPSTNELSRWRGEVHFILGGKHFVGDYEDGRLYEMSKSYYLDGGDPILRLRATQTQENLLARVFYKWLQVNMQTGVGLAVGPGSDPQLTMRYSNNGGQSWSDYRSTPFGAIGDYNARCQFNRLGAGRNRVWEISTVDPVPFAVLGAVVDVDEGEN